MHWVLGGLVGLTALGLLFLVRRALLNKDLLLVVLALVIDLALQPVLLAIGAYVSGLRGLHGINGLVVLGLSILVAIECEEAKATKRTDEQAHSS